jgi:hypothetical protein
MSELSKTLKADPASFVHGSYAAGFTLTAAERDEIHLAGLARRFETLRPRLSALDKLAQEQSVDAIARIDDIVPLLFPHTVYKSYPLSFLEKARFDRLTRWLDGLTTVDLSGVDTTGIETIDDWIRLLDRTTELRVLHTFGTSGKLSFLPRTREQWITGVTLTANCLRDWNGPGTGPDLLRHPMPLIQPSYRHGASASNRGIDLMIKMYAGGDENSLSLYPEARFSADMASLAGRMRAAESRGEQGQIELSPALLARRDEFARNERERPDRMKAFFDTAVERFAGRDVMIFAVWPILFEWAEAGLAQGLRNVFGAGSVLMTGGGSKGRVLPDGWRQQIFDFVGFDSYYEFYGMSELMANCPRCAEGNFHIPPVLVPFVLDPDSGHPLPRTGQQTGRFALFDLMPDSYWGGLITGDEVTVAGWDEPCRCGRTGPYAFPVIRRFSETQGGDDKINCAGAPEAHDRAVSFLLEQSQ